MGTRILELGFISGISFYVFIRKPKVKSENTDKCRTNRHSKIERNLNGL